MYLINSSDIKVKASKLLLGDMDKKFLDHNAINTLCGGKSSMELESICVTVKGELATCNVQLEQQHELTPGIKLCYLRFFLG